MKKNELAIAQPLKIGRVTAKNRIWESPLWTRTAHVNGEVSELTIAHYAARAKGGTGMIFLEGTAVDARHTWIENEIRIDDDTYIPALSRLVEAVHTYNTPIICQLHHAGMFGRDPISPSGVPCYNCGIAGYIEPRAITTSEVEEIRDLFIEAAVRAQMAGFDGVDLHGSCAYLLEQFFSPHNNRRNDKYGGDLKRRMLLSLEILRGIRAKCGPDFLVCYSGPDSDLEEGGIRHEDSLALAIALEQEGMDFYEIQMDGTYETFGDLRAPFGGRQKTGQFEIAEIYKKHLHIPVATRGCGDLNPDSWEEGIASGRCDAIMHGHQMLADPETANKMIYGDKEDIRLCIHCQNCLDNGVVKSAAVTCTVNPGMANGEKPVLPALAKKKVLVAGGGPAGLEAARVSALRGHKVTLLEKSDRLGGNEYIGSLPVGKADLNNFTGWAERQCKKLGVEIKLNCEATADYIRKGQFDAVFVATGSKPARPPIPGIDGGNVCTAEDVLFHNVKLGNTVLVAGGGEVGVETADFIIENKLAQKVIIVEMRPELAMDMGGMGKGCLFSNFISKYIASGQLQALVNTVITEITPTVVKAMDSTFHKYELKNDNVILALGYAAQNKLADEIAELPIPIYVIGDAAKPSRIYNAIHQANALASEF